MGFCTLFTYTSVSVSPIAVDIIQTIVNSSEPHMPNIHDVMLVKMLGGIVDETELVHSHASSGLTSWV